MESGYYTKFGMKASGELNFMIHCNLIMKELSYVFKKFIDGDLDYITVQLTYDDIEAIKPYIIAEDFEKYRNISKDITLLSYLDGWTMEFEGVTESEIPIIRLSSVYYGYDIQSPVENLYLFLVDKYFSKNEMYRSYYGK